MANQIYRGFDIHETKEAQFPFKVYKEGNYIFAARTEEECYSFIDRTKRELAAKK